MEKIKQILFEEKNMKKLSGTHLIEELRVLVKAETKITGILIECLKEIDSRKLYLQLGHNSMFALLTKELKYTPAAAQRRIDAARLSRAIPELKESLNSGAINLSQVSLLAHAVRQKEKEQSGAIKVSVQQKQAMLEQVQSLDLVETQKLFAQNLDIKINKHELKSFQQDGSLRIEMTLTPEQVMDLQRVKELFSHQHLNPNLAEILGLLMTDYLKKKDPLRRDIGSGAVAHPRQETIEVMRSEQDIPESMVEAQLETEPSSQPIQNLMSKCKTTSKREIIRKRNTKSKRKAISADLKARIFQRDRCCQWTDPRTKIQCGSTFQLQVDHCEPVWQDGATEFENLQLLCAVHNRHKYQQEVRGKSVSF